MNMLVARKHSHISHGVLGWLISPVGPMPAPWPVDCFVVADMGLRYGLSMTTVNSVMDYNNYECWPIYVHTMANIDFQ
jgi:hypothetical protein